MRLLPLLLVPASLAFAQLPKKANDMGVEMGHYHLNVKDVDESKKLWMQIGATPVKIGSTEILKYPDALLESELKVNILSLANRISADGGFSAFRKLIDLLRDEVA